MRRIRPHWLIIGLMFCVIRADATDYYVNVSHDGPVVIGGTITLRADLFEIDGTRPSGTFSYRWEDNALRQHIYETEATSNTTTYWTISYPSDEYIVGRYRVEISVSRKRLWWFKVCRNVVSFDVTSFLNGNLTLKQSNEMLESSYVSSKLETEMTVSLREGDAEYLFANATLNSTFWFIDCQYYGPSPNFTFLYNFTEPNETHVIEALVIASFNKNHSDPTPNPDPFGEITSTTVSSNATTSLDNSTTETTTALPPVTTPAPVVPSTPRPFGNVSFPFVCLNSSIISPDPHNLYGYFVKEVQVRAPITNVSVTGTNWLQPWELLSLKLNCSGTGPFKKCLEFHDGAYNVTKNETCKDGDPLDTCEFHIQHYFLDPGAYTIVVILTNDIGTLVSPVTVNVFKATPKPQLSVIVVPVSCSLVAIVVVVFGIAYYIQSRARFTVEVANFDFGQSNPGMEYKTFTERLRDSFNRALRPGGDSISGYESLTSPLVQ